MKILVTGCAGFIGAAVSKLLLAQGHSVWGVDNLNDYYDPRLKQWRLEGLRSSKTFTFDKVDVAEAPSVDALMSTCRPDAVVNLAARAGVRPSLEMPRLYYETNVLGTLNLLESCRKSGVRKFILASTSSVYGDGQMQFNEDLATDSPVSPYAASKKAAEVLAYTYHNQYALDVTVLRYFTVYGPAGRPDMAYFKFIRNLLRDEPITVFGDGSQRRDFTYIDDIAAGTVAALDTTGCNVINLGNNNPVELRRVIALIEAYGGKKATIHYEPRHPADVIATWADIRRAQELMRWKPLVSIEKGLEQTVRWFMTNRALVESLKS